MPKSDASVVIVDYGMGNLFSIERIINYLGGKAVISSQPSTVSSAKRLILPGVGAFGDGMDNLKKRGLVEPIRGYARSNRPLLGICLGMQLFMSESEEFGLHAGLDLIKGKVKRLAEPAPEDEFYKIPHVGWNSLDRPLEKTGYWQGTILENIQRGEFVYFVHSYAVIPDSFDAVLAETEYGNNRFCSALRRGNLFGCQFHPEISSEAGLRIMKNFLLNF